MTNVKKGKGAAYRFLLDLVGHQGDECVRFPFSGDAEGYGLMSHNGGRYRAHRFMCQLAHGEPPTPQHTAAHTCGKGHEGCVNPKHLEWKTQADNLADRYVHGTIAVKTWGFDGRLTEEQVQYVKDMRGKKPQRALAAELGVSLSCISQIMTGRSRRPVKLIKWFSPEQEAQVRELTEQGKNFSQIGRIMGRDPSSVGRLAKKLGLKKNYEPWPKGTDTSSLDRY